jgi:uncharacterized membrane protein (UPF0127 family)
METFQNNKIIPLFESYSNDGNIINIKIENIKLLVEVASTEESKQIGYYGKSEPVGNNGILFIYEKEYPLRFWMKNIPFALDILFFNEKKECVGFYTMPKYSGESDNNLPIFSKTAKYAVEVRSGWCNNNKIKLMCKLDFNI